MRHSDSLTGRCPRIPERDSVQCDSVYWRGAKRKARRCDPLERGARMESIIVFLVGVIAGMVIVLKVSKTK